MRREGFELPVSRPQVCSTIDGKRCEPIEEVTIDVSVIFRRRDRKMTGTRKGELVEMKQNSGKTRIVAHVHRAA
jgi:GTP-binding protein